MVLIVSSILLIFVNFSIIPAFGLLANPLFHDNLAFDGFNHHFPAFNEFTSIDHDLMPMDSIWSPGYPNPHHGSFINPFAHQPNPFLYGAQGINSIYPSMLDAEPSISTGSYSQSNRIGFGYGKGKGSSDIPEDVIDGIVAKVLVDEKLNPIFNPRRSRGYNRNGYFNAPPKSGYRKAKYDKKTESADGNVKYNNNGQYSNGKPTRPLDNGLQDLSRYVKSLRTVAWDDERREKDNGPASSNSPSSSYGDDQNGSNSNFGPVFKTNYKKNDGSYNVYGFLVPMGNSYKKSSTDANENNNNNSINNGDNVVRSAYARKFGQRKPCDSVS